MKLWLYFCFICFAAGANSWRIFQRGRHYLGNIGEPKSAHKTSQVRDIPAEWYTQQLDHFSPTEEKTWKQKYFTNDQYYNATLGGPVFLMLGGEGPAGVGWMTAGSWIDTAKKYGALLIQLEHRYYGDSKPTDDLSTESLKYLTSLQALADAASFISSTNQKYELPSDVKWIVFGGSYSGSLAAWLRFKYPHLVHGAVSSSGPLLAKVDFQEYFKVVEESLATHSDNCVTAIQQGVEQIGVLLKQQIGQQNLNEIFALCDPIGDNINNPDDISNFYESIADNFAGIVQYNKDQRSDTEITIDTVCDIMVNQTIGAPLNRLGKVNDLLLTSYQEKCLDYKYDPMIDFMKNISWESPAAGGNRQWIYQTCTEFGFYQTSSYEPHIFGEQFPIEFFIKLCSDIYGSTYDDNFLNTAIDRTNTLYGGLNIEVSNVVFVHGSIDPWHALGVLKTVSENAPAIYIEGTAHCANMYPPNKLDLPELTAAREQVDSLIGSWLQ